MLDRTADPQVLPLERLIQLHRAQNWNFPQQPTPGETYNASSVGNASVSTRCGVRRSAAWIMNPLLDPFWVSVSPAANGSLAPQSGSSLLVLCPTLGSCLLPGLRLVLPCPSLDPFQTLDPSCRSSCSLVGGSGEGRGWLGSNPALADADCFLPPAVSLLSSQTEPPTAPPPPPAASSP